MLNILAYRVPDFPEFTSVEKRLELYETATNGQTTDDTADEWLQWELDQIKRSPPSLLELAADRFLSSIERAHEYEERTADRNSPWPLEHDLQVPWACVFFLYSWLGLGRAADYLIQRLPHNRECYRRLDYGWREADKRLSVHWAWLLGDYWPLRPRSMRIDISRGEVPRATQQIDYFFRYKKHLPDRIDIWLEDHAVCPQLREFKLVSYEDVWVDPDHLEDDSAHLVYFRTRRCEKCAQTVLRWLWWVALVVGWAAAARRGPPSVLGALRETTDAKLEAADQLNSGALFIKEATFFLSLSEWVLLLPMKRIDSYTQQLQLLESNLQQLLREGAASELVTQEVRGILVETAGIKADIRNFRRALPVGPEDPPPPGPAALPTAPVYTDPPEPQRRRRDADEPPTFEDQALHRQRRAGGSQIFYRRAERMMLSDLVNGTRHYEPHNLFPAPPALESLSPPLAPVSRHLPWLPNEKADSSPAPSLVQTVGTTTTEAPLFRDPFAESWLFGTMSDDDRERIDGEMAKMGRQMEVVSRIGEDLLNVTLKTLKEHDVQIRNLVVLAQTKFDNLKAEGTLSASLRSVHATVAAIRTEVSAFMEAWTLAQAEGVLDSTFIEASQLLKILVKLEEKLKPMGLKLPVPPTMADIHIYYGVIMVRPFLTHQRLTLFLHVPLVAADRVFTLYKSIPWPYRVNLSDNKDLFSFYKPESDYIAVNADLSVHLLLSESEVAKCRTSELRVCSPTTAQHSQADSCSMALLTSDERRQLKAPHQKQQQGPRGTQWLQLLVEPGEHLLLLVEFLVLEFLGEFFVFVFLLIELVELGLQQLTGGVTGAGVSCRVTTTDHIICFQCGIVLANIPSNAT
ncbi:Nucleoid-associated protein BH02310 [Frankliniella fusca]|uniref:Nucleoid-associated protein BH02310 n=1 Tax=Frankliniella fusca TaxID=407009 RepID=A0AAE1GPY5_9NEOP|nr:Nucleoid-associated protein BH02310 [Frankliniella fusca]